MFKKLFQRKKCQAWSFDVILAVVIFIGAFLLVYFLFKSEKESPVEALRNDAEIIANELLSDSSSLNVVENGKIDEQKLQQLLDESYGELKSKVRVKSDFCIYLEDNEGNVLYIKQDVAGIGTDKIKISNVPCQ